MSGRTDLSSAATVLRSGDHVDPRHRSSIGHAAPHAEVRVLSRDDVEPARGEVGQIVVHSGRVMLGYWDRCDR